MVAATEPRSGKVYLDMPVNYLKGVGPARAESLRRLGIVTAREVKRINPSVPMIILSSLSQLPDETIGVVDRWILKDEGPQFLLNTIKDLLKPAS